MVDRRQALNQVRYRGHAEMTQNAASGNALAERMSHVYLDHKGHSAFASISKARAYIVRHGLTQHDVRGDREWDLDTYDLEAGWENAREIMEHRRASRVMRTLCDVTEEDLTFALYCIARIVDEEGNQNNRFLTKVLYNNTAKAQCRSSSKP